MKKSILALLCVATLFSCKKEDTAPQSNTPTNPPVESDFVALNGVFDGDGVGAAVNLTEDIVILFSQDGERYAWFEEGLIQLERDMNAANSHFADLALDGIGAATVLNNGQLYAFDLTGDMYNKIDYSVAAVDEGWNDPSVFSFNSPVYPIAIWGVDNSYPYEAVTAAWSYSDPGTSCFDATSEQLNIWMMSESGDEYARWSFPNGGTFVESDELENWTAENNCGGPDGLMPFNAISAAFRIIHPNKIQEVFFNEDGTKYCYYAVSEGVFSEIYDLY